MKKLLPGFTLFILIVFGGKCYGQFTQCNFILHDTSACLPVVLIASADDSSSSPINHRMWYLTMCDSTVVYTTSPGQNSNFSYVINVPGCYCLRMWSQDAQGNTCSHEQCNIIVSANPTDSFTFSPVEGCLPLTVHAQCSSTAGSGTIDSVVIDWGCYGLTFNNSCPANPISVTYSEPACSPGMQSPTVIIKNSFGCYAEKSFPNLINLIPDPIASFAADTTIADCTDSPLLVHFTADSADPHITYTWYINGLEVQSGANRLLTHSFPVDSNCYDVKLVVSHPSGCSDSLTKSGYICVRTLPLITFSQNISNLCVNAEHPDSLIFQNTSQGIPSLTWQLNSNPPQTFPSIYGPRAAFNITSSGTYTLTAMGVFAPGCSNTITRQVLVAQTRPIAAFTQSDSISCKTPFTVNYTSGPCAGCTYRWNFSTGTPSTSTSPNPSIVYNSFNSCNLSLVVTAGDGCADTTGKFHDVVLNQLQPSFISTRKMGCAPLCLSLYNTTPLTGIQGEDIASTCWSFPNSTINGGCQDSMNVCFTNPGCYNIKLITTTNNGCEDSITIPNDVCVANPPNNTLTVTPVSLCYQDSIQVTIGGDTISYAVVKIGSAPGQIYTSNSFSYQFTDTGHFCISVVTYRDSCKGDSLSTCVVVNPPIANFHDSTTCKTGDTVFLNNTSVGATSYKWYFCTGDSSILAEPYEILPYCDTCKVILVASNSVTGCQDKKTITINTACDSTSFTPTDTQGCAPLVLKFNNTSGSSNSAFTAWDWNAGGGVVWSGGGVSFGNVVTHTFTAPGTFVVAMRNESTGGCIDTIYSTVSVCQLIPDFTTNSGCFPAPFCFIDSSTDLSCGVISWAWSFGDSTTSNVENPCHVYPAPGTYHAKLVITNSLGCRDSITKPVIISSPVNVSFSLDTFVCPGAQTCINNNSTGVALVYRWTMPGAIPDTSTSASPCYTYPTQGNYPAYLNLSSNNQCAVNDTFMVHVHAPVAGGYASSTYISCPNPPQLIVFYDTSQYADTLWHWDFGDSSFSNQQNASHIYVVPGVYLVYETVTDQQGCSNTAFIDTITVAGPYGSVSYTPSAGVCACKDSVQFRISTSNALNVILLYGCNSGFAQISPNPIGSDSVPTIDSFMVGYCLTDTCRTKVIVDDATGCQVFLPDQLVFVDSPRVKIAFDSYGICYAGTVCFYDSTTYFFPSPQSYTLSRLWKFGDGHTDTAVNPCHYYSEPGIYNVKLYIHSNLGCFDSLVNLNVIIPNYPVAAYYTDTPFTCVGQSLCFHDTSTADSVTALAYWIWDFGDGETDTAYSRTVCHVYTAAGPHWVKLCVFDSLGCSNCDSSSINVIANPVANAGGNQVICYGTVAQLNGTGGNNYHWSPPALFSNPDIPDPTVLLFNDTVVTFTVSNGFGCNNTDTISLTLARVFANFDLAHTYCSGNNVCVTDLSTGIHDSIISYWYSFGGRPIYGADNCYIFDTAGDYNITLIDIDNHGCTDTITKPIIVFSSPRAQFAVNDSVICSYQQLCLTDLSTSATQITNWLWNYGDNSGSSLSTPPCHTYNPPFQHQYTLSLVITDQNNCSDSVQLVETVNGVPHADFTWTTSCQDNLMPLLSNSLQGDTAIASCQWTIWLGEPNPTIVNNCSTSYQFPPGNHDVQLIVTDFNGCSDTIVQSVITDSVTSLSLVPADTTVCLGTSIDYHLNGVFNHAVWTNNIWLSNPDSRVVTINPLGDVSYIVGVQNGVCAPVSDSFSIHVIQPVPIEVDATPQQIVLGLTSNITSQVTGHIDSIVWTPDSTLNCHTCPNPIARPEQTTTYIATIYYTQNGVSCSNSAQVTIDVLNSCDNGIIFVPNTFTPNGDGLNDIFMIRGIAATKIDYFRVFDRWGRLVFEATSGVPNDPQFGWDGTDRQGKKLNPDVYVYTYEIQCINGNIVTGQGNVTLVR